MRSALAFVCLCMPAVAAFSVGAPIGITRAVQPLPMSRISTAGLAMSEGPVINRQGLWGQGEAPECCWMGSSLEAIFLYGYFGKECFIKLAPFALVLAVGIVKGY